MTQEELNEKLVAAVLDENTTIEEIKNLIDAGADVNAEVVVDDDCCYEASCMALMCAQTPEQTRLLLEAGADVNAKDENGYTALMCARTPEQTKLLIGAGADVNAKAVVDDDFCYDVAYTALGDACKKGNTEKMKLLIEAGADVNAKVAYDNRDRYEHEEYCCPVLMTACEQGNLEQIKLLLNAGADVNAISSNNETVLMFACRCGDVEQIKLLLDAGADVNAQSIWGKTALMTACERGNLESVKLLLDAGADVKTESVWSKTAFDCTKNVEIKEILNKAKGKAKVEERKCNLLKERKIRHRMQRYSVSGTVLADKIAEAKISGQEKRVITPEVGGELAGKYVKELIEKKGR